MSGDGAKKSGIFENKYSTVGTLTILGVAMKLESEKSWAIDNQKEIDLDLQKQAASYFSMPMGSSNSAIIAHYYVMNHMENLFNLLLGMFMFRPNRVSEFVVQGTEIRYRPYSKSGRGKGVVCSPDDYLRKLKAECNEFNNQLDDVPKKMSEAQKIQFSVMLGNLIGHYFTHNPDIKESDSDNEVRSKFLMYIAGSLLLDFRKSRGSHVNSASAYALARALSSFSNKLPEDLVTKLNAQRKEYEMKLLNESFEKGEYKNEKSMMKALPKDSFKKTKAGGPSTPGGAAVTPKTDRRTRDKQRHIAELLGTPSAMRTPRRGFHSFASTPSAAGGATDVALGEIKNPFATQKIELYPKPMDNDEVTLDEQEESPEQQKKEVSPKKDMSKVLSERLAQRREARAAGGRTPGAAGAGARLAKSRSTSLAARQQRLQKARSTARADIGSPPKATPPPLPSEQNESSHPPSPQKRGRKRKTITARRPKSTMSSDPSSVPGLLPKKDSMNGANDEFGDDDDEGERSFVEIDMHEHLLPRRKRQRTGSSDVLLSPQSNVADSIPMLSPPRMRTPTRAEPPLTRRRSRVLMNSPLSSPPLLSKSNSSATTTTTTTTTTTQSSMGKPASPSPATKARAAARTPTRTSASMLPLIPTMTSTPVFSLGKRSNAPDVNDGDDGEIHTPMRARFKKMLSKKKSSTPRGTTLSRRGRKKE